MADYPVEVEQYSPEQISADEQAVIASLTYVTEPGVVLSTIQVSLSHPTEGTVNAIVDGVFQSGWSGTITPSGNGYAIIISSHPALALGLWTVTFLAATTAGGSVSFSWPLQIATSEQTLTNAIDVVFGSVPQHFDPAASQDALNLANYVVTGPVAPLKERLIQTVTYQGSNTIRIWFDGPLVAGEYYEITLSNIEDEDDNALAPVTLAFFAFGEDEAPVLQEQQNRQKYDLKNPQIPGDAPEGEPLGTFVIDDSGDLGNETQRDYLRKRCFRRLGTKKGSIFHLPDYGVTFGDKKLYTPTRLRQLKKEIEDQMLEESDVIRARATVGTLTAGVIYAKLYIKDKFGNEHSFTHTFGDEQ